MHARQGLADVQTGFVFKARRRASPLFLFQIVLLCAAFGPPALAQSSPGIQDNSFLIEEAYNQEYGVVQHINNFLYLADANDWAYTFTQEWPVTGIRHQLSYTLTALRKVRLLPRGRDLATSF